MSPAAEARLAELVDDFEVVADLGDPGAPIKHLLDLGKTLPDMPDAYRTDANRVPGCTAVTHLVVEEATPDHVRFVGDSEAGTTRGLIAVLHRVLNDAPAADVRGFDEEDAFRRLGFAGAISASRSNAFVQLVKRLKGAAEQA